MTTQLLSGNELKERNARIPSLDGLRAVSILMVVGAHALSTSGINPEYKKSLFINFLLNGEFGVKIFFIISGFIITWLLLKEEEKNKTISLKAFYLRRILRIIPTYFIFLLSMVILSQTGLIEIPASALLAAFTFTTGIWGESTWILGHTWSLSVEEQFYLLWPFLLVMIKNDKKRLICTLVLLVIFPIVRVLIYLSAYRENLAFLFITQGDIVIFGCMAALVHHKRREWLTRFYSGNVLVIRIVLIAAIFGVFLMGKYFIAGYLLIPFANTVLGFSMALLVLSCVFVKDRIANFLNNRVVVYIGFLSYSLYIWQQLFLQPRSEGNAPDWYTTFPVNVILSLALAILNYHLIEKTFLKMKRRIVQEHPEPVMKMEKGQTTST